jgi:hypothetical protein
VLPPSSPLPQAEASFCNMLLLSNHVARSYHSACFSKKQLLNRARMSNLDEQNTLLQLVLGNCLSVHKRATSQHATDARLHSPISAFPENVSPTVKHPSTFPRGQHCSICFLFLCAYTLLGSTTIIVLAHRCMVRTVWQSSS